jgi:stress response protein SCP2
MAINLQKGQRISLEKEAPGLAKVMCGLGWDVADKSGGIMGIFQQNQDIDIDASVFCLDANEKLHNNQDVIYYRNLEHPSGAIAHQGDNLTGEGEGDDEEVFVDLRQIPEEFSKLVFVVNIYDCLARKQDFSTVENAFVRLVNRDNNEEIARYNLSGQEYEGQTGTIVAEISRQDNNEWQMEAIGKGIRIHSLKELVSTYS